MLLEIAVGDAYGAGFEFCEREKIIKYNNLSGFIPHQLGNKAGLYTDDTQMSIAISDVLLNQKNYSSLVFSDAFVNIYKRDPRLGYAKGLQSLLEEAVNGEDLLKKIIPTSQRNGAAMRSVPLGLIKNQSILKETAKQQASVTHNTPVGILSSQVIALIAHLLIYNQIKLTEIPIHIQNITGFNLESNWAHTVECDAIQTLHAVNTALLRNRSMAKLLIDCVNFGGDVDSVAAIAMGLASLSHEYQKDIPSVLYDNLENGLYGKDFLIQQDIKLKRKYLSVEVP